MENRSALKDKVGMELRASSAKIHALQLEIDGLNGESQLSRKTSVVNQTHDPLLISSRPLILSVDGPSQPRLPSQPSFNAHSASNHIMHPPSRTVSNTLKAQTLRSNSNGSYVKRLHHLESSSTLASTFSSSSRPRSRSFIAEEDVFRQRTEFYDHSAGHSDEWTRSSLVENNLLPGGGGVLGYEDYASYTTEEDDMDEQGAMEALESAQRALSRLYDIRQSIRDGAPPDTERILSLMYSLANSAKLSVTVRRELDFGEVVNALVEVLEIVTIPLFYAD